MKDTERRFFRYLIRQIDYENLGVYCGLTANLEVFIDHYSETKNVPAKQLLNYIDKWVAIRMADYSIDLHDGVRTTEFQFVGLINKNQDLRAGIRFLSFNEFGSDMPDVYRSIIPKRVLRKIASKLNKAYITTAHIHELYSNDYGSIASDTDLFIWFPHKCVPGKKYLCTFNGIDHVSLPNALIITNVYDMCTAKLPSIEDLCTIIEKNYFTVIPSSIMCDRESGMLSYCLTLPSTLSLKDDKNWDELFRIFGNDSVVYPNIMVAWAEAMSSTLSLNDIGDRSNLTRPYEEFGRSKYLNITSCDGNILAVKTDHFCDLSDEEMKLHKSEIEEFVDWFIVELGCNPYFKEFSKEDIEIFFNPDMENVIYYDKKVVVLSSIPTEKTFITTDNQVYTSEDEYIVGDNEMITVGFKYIDMVIFYTGGGKNIDRVIDNYSFLTKYIAEALINRSNEKEE